MIGDKNMKKNILFMLLLFLPLKLFGATQGSLGTTSQGSVLITLTLGKVAQISSLNDISISYTPGVSSGNAVGFSSACVYTNSSSASYTVTATSGNATSGVMYVSTGGGTPLKIKYTATWFITATPSGGGTALTNATASSTITGANTSSTTCGGTPNSSIQVTFLAADLQAATAGTYTDTLTLLVSPV